MKHLLLPLVALVSVTVALGCGGDDDDNKGTSDTNTGATCSLVSACGGNVVGNWKIAGFCPDKSRVPLQVQDVCPTAKLDYDAPTVSGTLVFKDDKTFTQTATAKGTGYLVLDKSCVEDVQLDCPTTEDLLNKNWDGAPLDCKAGSNGGCRCAIDIDEPNAANSGTYATAGNTLTLTGATGDEIESTYCAQGSDKLYVTLNLTAGSAGSTTLGFTGQLQLTK